MFVYIIVNDVNSKIYIGKTRTSDLQKYLTSKFWDAAHQRVGVSCLFNAIRKYGPEHFHIHALISTLTTNEDLCFWERVLIAQYDSQNPDIGYNICRGGEGFTGPHSEETKVKLSNSQKHAWKQRDTAQIQALGRARGPKNSENGCIQGQKNVVTGQIKTLGSRQGHKNAQSGHCAKIAVLGGRASGSLNGRTNVKNGHLARIRSLGGKTSNHIRWHVNRGVVSPSCSLCAKV